MADLRRERPVRYAAGLVVYWLIWGPALAVALPFAAIGALTNYLADRLFPRIAGFVQPAFALVQKAAIRSGNFVLGYHPDGKTNG